MIFPVIQYLRFRRKKLSDIEYLSRISNGEIGASSSSRLFATGEIASTTGEIVSIVPASGKDFYLIDASIYTENYALANNSFPLVVEVKNDTNIRDHLGGHAWRNPGGDEGGSSATPVKTHSKAAIGDKLVGDGVKKYLLNSETNSKFLVQGTISGFIITAGASPEA